MSKSSSKAYPFEQRPIVISKMMMDQLLQCDEKWKRDVGWLFLFYCYTTVWQKTFTPKCTTTYASKALNMSIRSIRRAKAELIRLGMIEEITKHGLNKAGKCSIYYYIRVHYFENKTVPSRNRREYKSAPLEKTPPKCLQSNNTNTHYVRTSKCLQSHTPGARKSDSQRSVPCFNSNGSQPTLFDIDKTPKKRTFSDRMSKKLYIKVKSKNQLPFNSKSRSRWTTTFNNMLKEDGREKKRIRKVLEWYIKHYGESFIPEARCANTFRKKFCEIESAMNRWLEKNGIDKRESDAPSVIVHHVGERMMD